MRVAVVGRGAMGSRIAQRLAANGHDVVEGRQGDVVITMVTDDEALRSVTDDVLASHPQHVVQMSTVSPAAMARLAAAAPPGTNVVDAPVLGSIGEAESGTLTIFAGGHFEPVRPLLETLGTVLPVGPVGSGAAAKLVANATLFGVLAALGESVALGRTLGLPDEALFDVLAATPLSAQAERRRAVLQGEASPPRFPVRLARKDAALITDALDLPLLRAARSWLEAVDDGDADYTALLSEPSRAARADRSSS